PGVAVVADSTWAAMKGRKALDIRWKEGPHAAESTESLRRHFEEVIDQTAEVLRDDGDAEAALAGAAQVVEATYALPYLAHATMEPMNATAHVHDGGAELWLPVQHPTWNRGAVAEALGLPPENVRVHTTLLGGGFGRRANPDVAVEAALLSKAVGAPVQVVWSREDDIQHDFYRPANYHRLQAGLDEDGAVVAWQHRLSTPAIGAYLFGRETNGEGEARGAWDLPYGIPNLRVAYAPARSGVPRGWWRSVEHSYNGFVVNAFFDEVAAAAGRDPYELRLDLLDRTDPDALAATLAARHGDRGDYAFDLARYRNVLVTAAEKAGWGTPLPDGTGRGIAAHWSFLTYVAEVAEVTVGSGGQVVVNRVVCVVDCGQVVNPRTVEEQMEGAIIYGLTAALKGHLDVEHGRIVQSNFHDYEMLRMNEAPAIEVHLVPSTKPPSGAGEPGLPPAAPAVAAAIYDATGKRVRRLPIALDGLS
ncbi:MAG: molybdopterin cofactor-binding domain-containing protein, partial [Rhodothermales bacterium]|nr:molybdopterin cofactor-binding domain-containing protein [Rhodothermales bacterium]